MHVLCIALTFRNEEISKEGAMAMHMLSNLMQLSLRTLIIIETNES